MAEKWTNEELELLKKYWATEEKTFIQNIIPGRTWSGICHEAYRLGIERKDEEYWKDSEIATLIKHYPYTTKEMMCTFLPNRSYLSIKTKASVLGIKKCEAEERPISSGRKYISNLGLDVGDKFRFGIVSDTHFGSRYAQITWLHDFYTLLNKKGIKIVFHAGDLSDGNGSHYPGQRFEMHINGADNLKKFVVNNYPKLKDGKTYIVSGWHDLDLWVREGNDLLEKVCEERKDLEYLGQNDAYYMLGDRRIYLIHPAGGTVYALSYRLQKLVESFSPENKPHIAIVGHYHKSEFIPALRNVYCFQAGCFQAQTPFAVRHNIQFQYGGWIVEMTITKEGISGMKTEFIPFYIPIKDDYKRY